MEKSFETGEGTGNATDIKSRRVKRRSALVWSGAAATGLCAAGFAAFIASAKHRKDSLDKNNAAYVDATDIDTMNDADTKRREDQRRGLAYNRAAWGFGIATGVFAVGTVVAGVLMKSAEKDQTKKETPVSFSAGALEVRF